MSQQEHTQGKMSQSGFIISYAPGRGAIADTPDIARRLSACWNACQGFSTELLENITMLGDTLQSRFKLRDEQEAELQSQRDVLLKLLKDIRRALELANFTQELHLIDAAIAHAERGAG